MNISDRLDRIEARLNPSKVDDTIWVHLVTRGPLNRPVSRIHYGSQEWHRLEGEAEEAFRARAEAEAILRPGGSRLLMIME
jgi:hypothetical protein